MISNETPSTEPNEAAIDDDTDNSHAQNDNIETAAKNGVETLDETTTSKADINPQTVTTTGSRYLPFVLLAALGAITALGWGWQQGWLTTHQNRPSTLTKQPVVDVSQLQQQIGTLQNNMTTLRSELGALNKATSTLRTDVDTLKNTSNTPQAQDLTQIVEPMIQTAKDQLLSTFQSQLRQLDNNANQSEQALGNQQSRLQTLEKQLIDVNQQQQLNRNTQGRAQALYEVKLLLRYAQQQLLLSNNAEAALAAYQEAEAIVTTSRQIDTTKLHAALVNERQAIQAVEVPNVDALLVELRGLQHAVNLWPLRNESTHPTTNAEDASTPTDWRSKLRSSFGQLVQVRKAGEVVIGLEQATLIRQQLFLHLQTATLLALQGKELAYQNLLNDTQQLLTQHFSIENRGVTAAISTVQNLSTLSLQPRWPDLGAAAQQLQTLIQYSNADSEHNDQVND